MEAIHISRDQIVQVIDLLTEVLKELQVFPGDVDLTKNAGFLAARWCERLMYYRREVAAFDPTILDSMACTPFAKLWPSEMDWYNWIDMLNLTEVQMNNIFRAFAVRLRTHLEEHGDLVLPSGHPVRLEEGGLALF